MHVHSRLVARILPFIGGMAAVALMLGTLLLSSTSAHAEPGRPIGPLGIPTATPPAPPTPEASVPSVTPEPSVPSVTPAPPASATPAPSASPVPSDLPVPSASPAPSRPSLPQDDGDDEEPEPIPEPTPVPPTPVPPTAMPMTEIELVKTIDHEVCAPGATATYTLTARNTSSTAAKDVVITDDVPARLEVIDLHSTKGNVVVDGQNVSAFPVELAPGEDVSVTITVRVHMDTPAGQIVNWGKVTTSSHGDQPDNNSDDALMIVQLPPADPQELGDPVPAAQPPAAAAPAIARITTQQQPQPLLPQTSDPHAWTSSQVLPWTLVLVAVLGGVGTVVVRHRGGMPLSAPSTAAGSAVPVEAMPAAPVAQRAQCVAPIAGVPKIVVALPAPIAPGPLPERAHLDRSDAS